VFQRKEVWQNVFFFFFKELIINHYPFIRLFVLQKKSVFSKFKRILLLKSVQLSLLFSFPNRIFLNGFKIKTKMASRYFPLKKYKHFINLRIIQKYHILRNFHWAIVWSLFKSLHFLGGKKWEFLFCFRAFLNCLTKISISLKQRI